jgi:hypothetical protein
MPKRWINIQDFKPKPEPLPTISDEMEKREQLQHGNVWLDDLEQPTYPGRYDKWPLQWLL